MRRLQDRVEEALAGQLEPDEGVIFASYGMHPNLTSGGMFLTAIVVGFTAGTIVHFATGWWSQGLLGSLGGGTAWVAHMAYLWATLSVKQRAGMFPLHGLTTTRLFLLQTDFWGRPTAARLSWPIAAVQINIEKSLLSLPEATLAFEGEPPLKYRISRAGNLRDRLQHLQSTAR